MATRGPVPKRSDARHRRNAPANGQEVVTADGASVVEVPASSDNWHDVARLWFESLAKSGQRQFYEPSDWAVAYLIAESISRDLNPQFVGVTAGEKSEPIYETIPLKGASLGAYLRAMTDLLVTEGSRRRALVELQRPKVPELAATGTDGNVTGINSRRAKLLLDG